MDTANDLSQFLTSRPSAEPGTRSADALDLLARWTAMSAAAHRR